MEMGGEGVAMHMLSQEMMNKWEQSLCQRSEAIALREELVSKRELSLYQRSGAMALREELVTKRERYLTDQFNTVAGQRSALAYQEQTLVQKVKDCKEAEKAVKDKEQALGHQDQALAEKVQEVKEAEKVIRDKEHELMKHADLLESELERFKGTILNFDSLKKEKESLAVAERKIAKDKKTVEMMGKMLKIGVLEMEKMKKDFHKKRIQEVKWMQQVKQDWVNKFVEPVKTFQDCMKTGVEEHLCGTLLLQNIRVYFQELSAPELESPLRPHPFL